MRSSNSNALPKFCSHRSRESDEPCSDAGRQSDSLLDRLRYDRFSAAEILSISLRTLDYRISSGKIKTHRDGNKVLIPRSELVRYARTNHADPVRPTDKCRTILVKQTSSNLVPASDVMNPADRGTARQEGE